MPPKEPVASAEAIYEETADLAKAFQELAKGERTATMLENQLSRMEERIEALLQQAEEEQVRVQDIKKEKSHADASSTQTHIEDRNQAGPNG